MLGVRRRRRCLDRRLEMLVEQGESVLWRTLEHVFGEHFSALGPVVQRDKAESDGTIGCRRATVQPLAFIRPLVFAKASNDLANAVEVVPPALAKEADPAIEQPVQQAPVP